MEAPVIVSIILGVLTMLALIVLYFLKKSSNPENTNQPTIKDLKPLATSQPKHSHSGVKSKRKYQPIKRKNMLEPHPLLAANFKGHTDRITGLSFSSDGKYLASISKDGSLRVWIMKSINDKEKKFRSLTLNGSHVYNYDFAVCVAFSPDGKAVFVCLSRSDQISAIKVARSGNTLNLTDGFDFTSRARNDDNISLSVASNGSYILICNLESFTLWKIKGNDKLAEVTTNMADNNCAVVSPCSRFIACCGFTTSVKIYEVTYTKSNEFEKISHVMSLNGHSASVVSIEFFSDSKRIVSVSKDKTCRIWDIDVQYKIQEPTRCLKVISLDPAHVPGHVTVSPDGLVLATSVDTSIMIHSVSTGELLYKLEEVHNDSISSLVWSPNSSYLVSADTDRFIRVWHNMPGMKEKLIRNNEELKSATSEALKERLRKDNEDIQKKLDEIGSL